jgi:hypothetical protein
MRDDHARPINGPENFTETLVRAVRDIKGTPRGKPRQSIHQIMARDTITCSRPIRLWTARPRRRKNVEVWRFFVDIAEFKETGQRFRLRKCLVTGRRPGDGEFDRDSDSEGDDGGDTDGDNDRDYDGDEDGNEHGNQGGDEGGDEDGEGGRPDGRNRRARGRERRRDDEDNDDDDDGFDRGPRGGNRGDNAAPEREYAAHSAAGAPRPSRNDNGNQQGGMRLRLGGRLSKRQHSTTTPSIGRKAIKRSISNSPFFSIDGLLRSGSETSIKRERSASPGLEITGSRAISSYIDLTSDGDPVDLTQDDYPEE